MIPGSLESTGAAIKGNYAIVGTFLPGIEIHDLNVTDSLKPDFVLGGEETDNYLKSKKFHKGHQKLREGSHKDGVAALHLNPKKLGILVSGSAESTAKIWDLSSLTCVHTYPLFSGAVVIF